jgi:hypothetical protein
MEKGVSILIFVLAIFMIGLLVYFSLESRNNNPSFCGNNLYNNNIFFQYSFMWNYLL